MGTLRRILCALRGHDDYLHFDKNKVCLQCIACGYESPGWAIGEPRHPVLRFPSRPAARSRAELIRKTA